MKRSIGRILTTHTGSLPRPHDIVALLNAREEGRSYDKPAFAACARNAVAKAVAAQIEAGVDIVGDGEQSKVNFRAYAKDRLSGLETVDEAPPREGPTRDEMAFPGAYQDARIMLAARSPDIVPKRAASRSGVYCTGPVKYIGHEDLAADLANLKASLDGAEAEEAFVTAISPSNLEHSYPNRYYATGEEYLAALADAMHVEFKAIVDAGFLLQVDDPRMATHYNRTPDASIADCRRFIALRVEALNHALRGIPEDRVRLHTCYSVNIAPRVHDMELADFVDLMLDVRAGAYSLEASNPRHEHEWQVWQDTRLPDGKILIPGMVTHCSPLVEHPELVAQRIERFADVVGRENVVASTDCGFGTSAARDELHPEIAWAKLRALSEGARIASTRLWRSHG